jgi:hypothetical protein
MDKLPEISRASIMTEARRLAKNLIKDEMKRQGIRISYVEAKDITALANELLLDEHAGYALRRKAKANLHEAQVSWPH